ncbi:unnamed protein product [Pleuronectes platessa]|uniref:Uncharacterized protein n=1 Tax=Pleuronectes platessa TaxID=8262 RepID=A0A9N7Y737_PLEPL|nr:unnamed protein product [Pleuronectes platessa]
MLQQHHHLQQHPPPPPPSTPPPLLRSTPNPRGARTSSCAERDVLWNANDSSSSSSSNPMADKDCTSHRSFYH